jgi:hypothetical protein
MSIRGYPGSRHSSVKTFFSAHRQLIVTTIRHRIYNVPFWKRAKRHRIYIHNLWTSGTETESVYLITFPLTMTRLPFTPLWTDRSWNFYAALLLKSHEKKVTRRAQNESNKNARMWKIFHGWMSHAFELNYQHKIQYTFNILGNISLSLSALRQMLIHNWRCWKNKQKIK